MPFLELLRKHSFLKVVLHYSGILLSWIEKKHPEAIDTLKGFVKAQRAEILSGGFYEPILSALPETDRIMQIEALTDYISELLDYRPKGMWLAERVWEPHMPRYLSSAGTEYISLDDYHFKLSGLDERDLSGYFLTEESGRSVKVFPGSEKLRYFIPFKDVKDVMSYLREVYSDRGSSLLTLADDGEKFGVWPKTYKHCYENGWLEGFFSALEENSDWIETTTFSDYSSSFRPVGTVYLPTASYREMGEWVLSPEKGIEYEQALGEMEKLFGDKAKSMVRGGTWRSFLSKYPESNHIHKRMLMIGGKVHEAIKQLKIKNSKKKSSQPSAAGNQLLHELWKGQCNDAYWHGIFGGLYLPHLRSSLYRHLITAESMAEDILENRRTYAGGKGMANDVRWKTEGDLDCDGFRDICISNKDLSAFFTERGGGLIELSLKKRSINILDALTRRREAYHSKIAQAGDDSGETKTIHERLSLKEAGLADHLIYDKYTRASLLDHFFDKGIAIDSLMRAEYEEMGDFIDGIYGLAAVKRDETVQVTLERKGTASGRELRIEKKVKFRGSAISADYFLDGGYSGFFGIEFNLSLLGSPYAEIGVNEKSLLIKDRGTHEDVAEFSITDTFLDLGITFSFDDEIALWHYPVETVSLSEEGIEKIYQGTAFLFMKRLDFMGRKRLGFKINFGRLNEA